jgi:flagellar hook protein FlgE
MAELSLAAPTSLPVEIWFWVSVRLLLIEDNVCRATIAPLFVRMLVIALFL